MAFNEPWNKKQTNPREVNFCFIRGMLGWESENLLWCKLVSANDFESALMFALKEHGYVSIVKVYVWQR